MESGRIAVERLVDGEVLALQRGVGLGNHLGGLYTLINQNRADYWFGPNRKLYAQRQVFEFWDLFVKNGLLDVWKRMSDRYESGELERNMFDVLLGWQDPTDR